MTYPLRTIDEKGLQPNQTKELDFGGGTHVRVELYKRKPDDELYSFRVSRAYYAGNPPKQPNITLGPDKPGPEQLGRQVEVTYERPK